MEACWECGTVGEVHHHHPVPKSRGGTRTIPLCLLCHGKAHGRRGSMTTSSLTKEGLEKAKSRGVKVGRPCYGRTDDEAALVARVVELREQGLTLHQVSATIDGEGYKARNGAALSVSSIHRIIKREATLIKC